ncbi:MAG: hypothetical protein ACREPR_10120 [Brasilonema sp.]
MTGEWHEVKVRLVRGIWLLPAMKTQSQIIVQDIESTGNHHWNY